MNTTKETSIYLHKNASSDDITRLIKSLGLISQSTSRQTRKFYDSFDSRLYLAGDVLECICDSDGQTLIWRKLNDNVVQAKQTSKISPTFWQDLPAGDLQDRLKKILDMRALITVVSLQSEITHYILLNKDQKTIFRLRIEHIDVQDPDQENQWKRIGSYIIPESIRGYDKGPSRFLRFMHKNKNFTRVKQDLYLDALKASGRKAVSFSSKFSLTIDPHMRADMATRHIFLALLKTIKATEAGVKSDLDSEFLHDFRVSIRKTRSGLSHIRNVFEPTIVTQFKQEFAWLGKLTGPTRDLDVYLLKFDTYRSSLPKPMQPDLNPLHTFLVNHQSMEHAEMVRNMNSERYQDLLNNWQQFLESDLPLRSSLTNANLPVYRVADKSIRKIYNKVIRDGLTITDNSPAESLHDLRKRCKNLRYLVDFFQSMYPSEKVRRLIKVVKLLQENLGDFQDYETQALKLREFAQQMEAEGAVPRNTLAAIDYLADDIEERQQYARLAFGECFADFAMPVNQKLVHNLLDETIHRRTLSL